jgi:hypothetical protein
MQSAFFRKMVVLGGVALAITACNQPDYKQIARENGLNKTQQENLALCDQAFFKIFPVLEFDKKLLQISTNAVPMEICICHAKDMTNIIKPGKITDYAKFSKWWRAPNQPKLPMFSKNAVKGTPESAARSLIASFDKCTKDFVTANKDKEEYQDLLREPILKEKKKKKAPKPEEQVQAKAE